MIRLLNLILLISVIVSGCATAGKYFDSKKVNQIQICKTTASELSELFGEPFQEGGTSSYRTMVWQYAKVSHFSQEGNRLIVYLDQKNRVIEYRLNPTSLHLTDDFAGDLPSKVLNKCEK